MFSFALASTRGNVEAATSSPIGVRANTVRPHHQPARVAVKITDG
jgi:hypothetical protein